MSITSVEYVTLQNNNNNKDIQWKNLSFSLSLSIWLLNDQIWLLNDWHLTLQCSAGSSAGKAWQPVYLPWQVLQVCGRPGGRQQQKNWQMTKFPQCTKSARPAYAVPHDPLFKSLQQQQASQLEYLQRSWSSPRQTEFRPQTTAGFFKVSLKWQNTSNSLIFPC